MSCQHATKLQQSLMGSVLPQSLQGIPVLYPLGGADVMSAIAMFPRAPQIVMLALMPANGTMQRCFLTSCKAEAAGEAAKYFAKWASAGCAWTESGSLMSMARSKGVGHLLSAGIQSTGDAVLKAFDAKLSGILDAISLQTARRTVWYVQADAFNASHMRILNAHGLVSPARRRAHQPSALLIKGAGPLFHQVDKLNAIQEMVGRSTVAVFDETGPMDQLLPADAPLVHLGASRFTTNSTSTMSVQPRWIVETRGNFTQLEAARNACAPSHGQKKITCHVNPMFFPASRKAALLLACMPRGSAHTSARALSRGHSDSVLATASV